MNKLSDKFLSSNLYEYAGLWAKYIILAEVPISVE